MDSNLTCGSKHAYYGHGYSSSITGLCGSVVRFLLAPAYLAF